MSAIKEAEIIINGPRRQEYGPASESFGRVATIWAAILDAEVTAEQVALCMAGFKMIREVYQHKNDNIVDAIGYLGLLDQMHQPNNET